MSRWAWIEIDDAAIAHNVAVLRQVATPSPLWAVVKANGYGHGAVVAARAALSAGAEGLCVALVQEGVELRAGGVTSPILVLTEQPPEELSDAVTAGLELTVYRRDYVAAVAAAARECGAQSPVPVHLKIDTGMRRVGVDPADAGSVAAAIAATPMTMLAGVFTHLAVADEPADLFSQIQLDRFDAALDSVLNGDGGGAGEPYGPGWPGGPDTSVAGPPMIHAANSAGALAHPHARRSMVRAGIAIYGISPGHGVAELASHLRPALSLHARVSFVKRVAAGQRISYGLRHAFASDTTVATLPLGYADGVPRGLFAAGGSVLLGGRRRPIVGVVTMDQIMIDCGDDDVAIGDHAVLIGRQGDEMITAEEWADSLGTIGYEIVCGFSSRLERRPAPP